MDEAYESRYGYMHMSKERMEAGRAWHEPRSKEQIEADAGISEQEISLIEAATTGDLEQLKAVLEAGVNVNVHEKNGHWTALHWACGSNEPECARVLLDAGAELDERNDNGETALHLACSLGRIGCVQVLLEAGADKGSTDYWNRTPLDCAQHRPAILAMLDPSRTASTVQRSAGSKDRASAPADSPAASSPDGAELAADDILDLQQLLRQARRPKVVGMLNDAIMGATERMARLDVAPAPKVDASKPLPTPIKPWLGFLPEPPEPPKPPPWNPLATGDGDDVPLFDMGRGPSSTSPGSRSSTGSAKRARNTRR